jgi:hypothetical protein
MSIEPLQIKEIKHTVICLIAITPFPLPGISLTMNTSEPTPYRHCWNGALCVMMLYTKVRKKKREVIIAWRRIPELVERPADGGEGRVPLDADVAR